ncbi:MAG: flagellar protein [Lachnospiraceae bacterium]|jgi:flagellar operon protein|nr:flagellar protein [Lachnospiraceae bacterium]
MKVVNNNFPSIEQVTGKYLEQKSNPTKVEKEQITSFQDILLEKTVKKSYDAELKFSKHAVNRLSDRKIELSGEQLSRLNEGTKKANAKGIQESLVLVDDLAFIVNVKNNTVITAMDQAETGESVFTNIDGAVII